MCLERTKKVQSRPANEERSHVARGNNGVRKRFFNVNLSLGPLDTSGRKVRILHAFLDRSECVVVKSGVSGNGKVQIDSLKEIRKGKGRRG